MNLYKLLFIIILFSTNLFAGKIEMGEYFCDKPKELVRDRACTWGGKAKYSNFGYDCANVYFKCKEDCSGDACRDGCPQPEPKSEIDVRTLELIYKHKNGSNDEPRFARINIMGSAEPKPPFRGDIFFQYVTRERTDSLSFGLSDPYVFGAGTCTAIKYPRAVTALESKRRSAAEEARVSQLGVDTLSDKTISGYIRMSSTDLCVYANGRVPGSTLTTVYCDYKNNDQLFQAGKGMIQFQNSERNLLCLELKNNTPGTLPTLEVCNSNNPNQKFIFTSDKAIKSFAHGICLNFDKARQEWPALKSWNCNPKDSNQFFEIVDINSLPNPLPGRALQSMDTSSSIDKPRSLLMPQYAGRVCPGNMFAASIEGASQWQVRNQQGTIKGVNNLPDLQALSDATFCVETANTGFLIRAMSTDNRGNENQYLGCNGKFNQIKPRACNVSLTTSKLWTLRSRLFAARNCPSGAIPVTILNQERKLLRHSGWQMQVINTPLDKVQQLSELDKSDATFCAKRITTGIFKIRAMLQDNSNTSDRFLACDGKTFNKTEDQACNILFL